MDIQWFPGHMAKAKRIIEKNLQLVDIVIEILDARAPKSSSNYDLYKIINKKHKLVLLNKSDLADDKITNEWERYYKLNNIEAVAIDSKSGYGLNKVCVVIKNILEEYIEKKIKRYMVGTTIRAMVVGVPNVGKSCFINKMAKKKKAKVEDRPGVTKGKQWIRVNDDLELLDMPGVLMPKFEDKIVGERLAFLGSINDNILDKEYLAIKLLEFLFKNYNNFVLKRYKIDENICFFNDFYHLLEIIGKKRGMIVSKGEIDMERTAIVVLDEFRSGKIGKISLEKPY